MEPYKFVPVIVQCGHHKNKSMVDAKWVRPSLDLAKKQTFRFLGEDRCLCF